MARVIAILSSFFLVFLFIAGIGFFRFFGPSANPFHRSLDAPALVTEVRSLNDLVTVRYSIQKVVGLKESRPPLGEESILLLVQARVLAGIDLSQLTQYDVTLPKPGTASIRLPLPKITEAFLDEHQTKVWDRHITWWTPWLSSDPNFETKARVQAVDEIRAEAIRMGILIEARRNAETDIRKILSAFGINSVTFLTAS